MALQTFLPDNEPVLISHHAGEKNYTASELAEGLDVVFKHEKPHSPDFFSPKLPGLLSRRARTLSFENLPPPGVSMDCWYGTGWDTLKAVDFGEGGYSNAGGRAGPALSPALEYPAGNSSGEDGFSFQHEDGDGVLSTRSVMRCADWGANGGGNKTVNLVGFAGAHHGSMAARSLKVILELRNKIVELNKGEDVGSKSAPRTSGEGILEEEDFSEAPTARVWRKFLQSLSTQ